ncbi:hypothetical protein [Amycolatopsis jejuensis]|uniref:hypothetical protein n=1 Tax=Amycolatopsis jejuensis TaxID=330084 RepID=UPI0012E09071|nr:hypothetical protein [Amycolatopsis jejuensis]
MSSPDTGHDVQPHDLDNLGPRPQAEENSPLAPIIAALTPDIREHGRGSSTGPLPMAVPRSDLCKSSIVYALCRLDDSGRFHDQSIINAVSWRSGERLRAELIHGVAVLIPSGQGPLIVTRRRSVALPSYARKHLDLAPKDKALLAAAPKSRAVIVYPLSAIDAMISHYHADQDSRQS